VEQLDNFAAASDADAGKISAFAASSGANGGHRFSARAHRPASRPSRKSGEVQELERFNQILALNYETSLFWKGHRLPGKLCAIDVLVSPRVDGQVKRIHPPEN
jgi:hypothetical protein